MSPVIKHGDAGYQNTPSVVNVHPAIRGSVHRSQSEIVEVKLFPVSGAIDSDPLWPSRTHQRTLPRSASKRHGTASVLLLRRLFSACTDRFGIGSKSKPGGISTNKQMRPIFTQQCYGQSCSSYKSLVAWRFALVNEHLGNWPGSSRGRHQDLVKHGAI